MACLALWSKEAHLVVSERNDLRRDALPAEWRALRPLLFQRADVVTANAQGTLDSLSSMRSLKHLMLLPNPLPSVAEGPSNVGQNSGFLTIARRRPTKGIGPSHRGVCRCVGWVGVDGQLVAHAGG